MYEKEDFWQFYNLLFSWADHNVTSYSPCLCGGLHSLFPVRYVHVIADKYNKLNTYLVT